MRNPTRPSGRSLPPDEELIARLRRRDESAFAIMLDAWSSGMLRLARTFVSTNDSAAEIVQETWLAVISSIESFERRSSLKTWVYRILINAAKRRSTRERKVIPWSSLVSTEDAGPTVNPARFRGPNDPYPGDWWTYPTAWQMPSPEQELLAGEIRGQVTAALAELPDRQRIVVTMRDIDGLTSDEVCAVLEISPANQRVLLHRGRAYVRGKLEDYFSTHGEPPAGGTVTP